MAVFWVREIFSAWINLDNSCWVFIISFQTSPSGMAIHVSDLDIKTEPPTAWLVMFPDLCQICQDGTISWNNPSPSTDTKSVILKAQSQLEHAARSIIMKTANGRCTSHPLIPSNRDGINITITLHYCLRSTESSLPGVAKQPLLSLSNYKW